MMKTTCIILVVLALAIGTSVALADEASREKVSQDLRKKTEKMTPEEQIEYLTELDRTGANHAVIDFFIGNAYFTLDNMERAAQYFFAATEGDSSYAKAWVNLGIAYDNQNQASAARSAYENAIKANPNDVLAYCHLGHNLFSNGKVSDAIKLYTRALEIDPNSAQAHYNLGLAFADARVFEEAILEWTKVSELDPDGPLGDIARENLELIRTYMELNKQR